LESRPAPRHPGGIPNLPDSVTREAYSHEVSSAGWWPGDATHEAFFYSYAYPTPQGFKTARVTPPEAYFDDGFGEFVLPYDDVRLARDPDGEVMGFLHTTFAAAAAAAAWPAQADPI
jgi:hypothetical protein